MNGSTNFNPNATEFQPFIPDINAQSFTPHRSKNKSAKSIQSAFRKRHSKKSDAAKKIQSLTRGRQSRTNTAWKKRDGLRYPLEVQKKIFFESVLGDDIIDRQDSLEELQKTLLRMKDKKRENYKSFASNANYKKLEDTGLFKDNEDKYITRKGDLVSAKKIPLVNREQRHRSLKEQATPFLELDPDQEINSNDSDIVNKRYLKDWYETTLDKINLEGDRRRKSGRSYTKQINLDLDEKMKHIESLEDLDMFKCKKMKSILEADPAMYNDPQISRYSDQCRNDSTRIFVDTFYKLRWNLIMPFIRSSTRNQFGTAPQRQSADEALRSTYSVSDKINSYPNDKFTSGAKSALIDTLLDLDLIKTQSLSRDRGYSRASEAETRFDELAFYFYYSKVGEHQYRRNQRGRQQRVYETMVLRHLHGSPSITFKTDGRTSLNAVLDLFEETVLSRNIRDKSPEKIERMKRYFIYSLIGLDSIPYYQDMVTTQITNLETRQWMVQKRINVLLKGIELLQSRLNEMENGDPSAENEILTGVIVDAIIDKEKAIVDKRAELKRVENTFKDFHEMNEYIKFM